MITTDANIEKILLNDLEYIKNDILVRQIDGKLCKFSRPLNAVSCMNMEDEQYLHYWESVYKLYPEYYKQIEEACMTKLADTGYSREDVITMIKSSRDFKSEKVKAIRLLGGSCNGGLA